MTDFHDHSLLSTLTGGPSLKLIQRKWWVTFFVPMQHLTLMQCVRYVFKGNLFCEPGIESVDLWKNFWPLKDAKCELIFALITTNMISQWTLRWDCSSGLSPSIKCMLGSGLELELKLEVWWKISVVIKENIYLVSSWKRDFSRDH